MTLTSQARVDLVEALQPHVAAIAEDLRQRLLKPAPHERAAEQAARQLHDDEHAGDRFQVWVELLARRAAVLWVLKLVYVRVLEDRELIDRRLTDPLHRTLFERLAPSLGDTAFLRWVYTDLAQERGGLPELFTPQPAEVLPPADPHTRELLALLCDRDPDTGERAFDFAGERFDGQLLGDLYQELDPVVKSRYALLQTPDFVRDFMLDRTLGEALATWPADQVRVIDPACGSGHFLIDAFRRLVRATKDARPDWSRDEVVRSALARVVGIDLNDYAAALARARLLMTAAELLGDGESELNLSAASSLRPQVFWADGLEQVERDEVIQGSQLELGRDPSEVPRAVLTPSATRAELRPLLAEGFHVVVANPPYITEKDKARKKYHKEKVGKKRRYISAYRTYSLGAPFTERAFQLAVSGGFVGLITANSFAKREFGRKVVQKVLARKDLSLLVDTSGAYIPGHGTPTILIFGRSQPPSSDTLTAVLGKRGEPSNPADPSRGKVWTAIRTGWDQPGFDSPFVSTETVPRETFASHPWSLRGGGALALQSRLEDASELPISELAEEQGFSVVTRQDDVYWVGEGTLRRWHIASPQQRPLVAGENVRSWSIQSPTTALWPYDPVNLEARDGGAGDALWRWRSILRIRRAYGKTQLERGLNWYEYSMFFQHRARTPLTITFAFVATHNHFVLDRGGKVFKQTAPVIKLPADATTGDHLALLGPLNSSAACFWMKQMFFNKGEGGGTRVAAGNAVAGDEPWKEHYEHDSTKLARFPLPPRRETTLPWARALDALGHARADDTVARVLDDPSWTDPATLRAALDTRAERDLARLREMTAHQEELDWLVYRLYGLAPAELPVAEPSDTAPITPGWRPFELRLAREDAEIRLALDAGEEASGTPTAWFTRHGWAPCTELPAEVDPDTAERSLQRLAAIEDSAELRLLEDPVHKRRWYRPDRAKEEQEALRTWLLDRIEETLKSAPGPRTPTWVARRLAGDPRVEAVVALIDGAVDLGALAAELMAGEAVPAHPLHRYKSKGLVKRRAWEQTWALQAKEDRGEDVDIPVPPKYTKGDFVTGQIYSHRGRLDVPKERFVAHTEVPAADGSRRTGQRALYGWAGWTREQRVHRLFDLLEDLDDEGVAAEHRVALHDLIFRYLAELARTRSQQAADLRADLRGEAGEAPTEAQLRAWLEQHPAKTRRRRRR